MGTRWWILSVMNTFSWISSRTSCPIIFSNWFQTKMLSNRKFLIAIHSNGEFAVQYLAILLADWSSVRTLFLVSFKLASPKESRFLRFLSSRFHLASRIKNRKNVCRRNRLGQPKHRHRSRSKQRNWRHCKRDFEQSHSVKTPCKLSSSSITWTSFSSLVSYGSQQRYLGEGAKTQEISNFKNTVASLKRLIGRPFTDPEISKYESTFVNCSLVEGDRGEVAANVVPSKSWKFPF